MLWPCPRIVCAIVSVDTTLGPAVLKSQSPEIFDAVVAAPSNDQSVLNADGTVAPLAEYLTSEKPVVLK